MNFVPKILFAAAVVVLMTSCRESDRTAQTIITAIRDTASDLARTGGAGCEIKIPASSPYTVVYFYPYTDFGDLKLEDSAKRELKEIAFAVEKTLFAVVGSGRVLEYGDVELPLEPSRSMPMIWFPQNGAICIGLRKKPDGQYILY